MLKKKFRMLVVEDLLRRREVGADMEYPPITIMTPPGSIVAP
jgi:hypothetical protein